MADTILVLEDGSIVPNANTYALSETVDAFHAAMKTPVEQWDPMMDQADKDAFVLNGMLYLDSRPFLGRKVSPEQPLAFPRQELVTRDGTLLPADKIPGVVIRALCILASKVFVLGPGSSLFPVWSDEDRLRRKKVDVLEREFFKKDAVETAVPLPDIDLLLIDLIESPLAQTGKGFQVMHIVKGTALYI